MPANSATDFPPNLKTKISAAEQELFSQFSALSPDLKIIVDKLTPTVSSTPATIITEKARHTTLSEDEVLSILQKLREVSQLPSASFDRETLLYLEQQLADILGFDLSSTLQDVQLPFTKAVISSLPNQQTTPATVDLNQTYLPEAGINHLRGYFGWESSAYSEKTSDQLDEEELFWLAFPLYYFRKTFASLPQMKSWWKLRKLVVINPTEAVAIVAQVKDDFHDTSNKYQLGGSPALIREGMFWSPMNLGKSLVFLVADADNQVASGKYTLFN